MGEALLPEEFIPDIWEAIIGSLFRDVMGIYEARFLLENPNYLMGAIIGEFIQVLIIGTVIYYLQRWWQKRKGIIAPEVGGGKSLLVGFISLTYLKVTLTLEKIATRTAVPVPGIITSIMILWAIGFVIFLALRELTAKKPRP